MVKPDPLKRPKRPSPSSSNPALQPSEAPRQRRGSGGGDRRGGGSGGSGGSDIPSPWLIEPEFSPDATASFVEYLRWMRAPGGADKDPTKVQILQMAEEEADYRDRLRLLSDRTRRIAGKSNCFLVTCDWRIRVGGHRGPESILLPAFDALGMPCIPSSTLRGVARTQAIRSFMAEEGLKWEDAEKKVAPYFGSLEAKGKDRSGKVVFLDAYPLPDRSGENGGLSVDMANNIWKWEEGDEEPSYAPNPNPFFSLKEATFLIGIRSTASGDPETLKKVKRWLILGLQAGIGSQVNTGYGCLRQGDLAPADGFFRVKFELQGQLIHGRQQFTQWHWNDRNQEWQMRGKPEAEVRPVAFKSMLRYWFRAFARGVLPPKEVQCWEGKLFGAIAPQQLRGWVAVRIVDRRLVQPEARPFRYGQNDPCGEQAGTLVLDYSSEAPEAQREAIAKLFEALTWMMFHLGGIGQGARRPCYSRQTRERAPWWRGSTLFPAGEKSFWKLPRDVRGMQQRFRERLETFYDALHEVSELNVNPRQPRDVGPVRRDRWVEAVDANCRIVVCAGKEEFRKPYALARLHASDLKQSGNYDGNLCGQVQGGVKPSPVWICDLDEYQVVTIYGATQNPRQKYLSELRRRTSPDSYAQIFPFR